MFSGNLTIENAIRIINSLEDGKFLLLLNRIAQFLSSDSSSKPFTPVEETKLETSLELNKSEVEVLIGGIIELFHVCSYYVIKPGLLSEQLTQGLSLNEKKTETFVQVWAASAKGIIENFKQKVYFPQLNHISYSVSVEMSAVSASKEKLPRAQLQLGIISAKEGEDVNLEFSHQELYEFYKKLEQIQGQLDALR